MVNFCIVTGETYSAKALVMYRSLVNTNSDFSLYYFCFDEQTHAMLTKLKKQHSLYDRLIPVKVSDVMDDRLREAKSNRTEQEFFFTLTPFVIDYAIQTFNLDMCAYLDADLYFYHDPKVVFDEMKDKSVLITKHNYTEGLEHLLYAGTYCVQFNPFRNDEAGQKVLNWWKDRCAEWCYLRKEDGKWGDQGYLNNWPEMFESVIVSGNAGVGVAPWNIDRFLLLDGNSIKEKETQKSLDIIFYHFQGVKMFFNRFFWIGNPGRRKELRPTLYKPYVEELLAVKAQLEKIDPTFVPIGNASTLKDAYYLLKQIIRRRVI